jgi:gliding motility-associated lipoprotein GldH
MIRGTNSLSFIILMALLVLLSSCHSNTVFTGSKAMSSETWKLMDIASFKAPVSDTLISNNVIFTMRTGSAYPFRNIFLFVTTVSPHGKSITDTLQYNLADEKGERYGNGFGEIRELDLPYKTNVYFPVKGIYQFNIQHGMRVEDLKGVFDFGLRIEKISK